MENRIQINGEWYVKEETATPVPPPTSFNPDNATHFEGCVYETNKYYWKATKIYKAYYHVDDMENSFYIDSVSIKFTNKNINKSEYWDNSLWFRSILNNDEGNDSHVYNDSHLYEVMDSEGVETFREFLKYLESKGWFK